MKILFVTRGWPSKANPMAGNYEAIQAKALAKRGVDVTVINMKTRSLLHIFKKEKVKAFDEDGVHVVQVEKGVLLLPNINLPYKWQACICELAFKRFFESYAKDHSFDVIHIHSSYVAYRTVFLKKIFNIPLVITEHWSALNTYNISNSVKEQARISYKWADKVICVSRTLSESLMKNFNQKSVVIHNMVSETFFKRSPQKGNDGKIKFVGVGSLIPGKAFDILIKGFSGMADNSNSELRIIGDGAEREQLQCLIENCHLQEKVFLVGLKKPEEVAELIESSDCFALTSKAETFGIVYIEAMAKGKPVIATICGGPENFVDETNGILIPVDDVKATTKALEEMQERCRRFDSEKIKKNCYDNFSEESIARKIIALYKNLLKEE